MRVYNKVRITEEPTDGGIRRFSLRNKHNTDVVVPFGVNGSVHADDIPQFIESLFLEYDKSFSKFMRGIITKSQKEHYKSLMKLYLTLQRRPTYQEVADHMEHKSRGTAYNAIQQLVKKGWVWIDSDRNPIPYDLAPPDVED